jgi:DNA-binding CsgD family transcriptional regulator
VIARQHVRRYAYWHTGFLAHLGFIEVSARDWTAALSPLRRLAELVKRFKMVDPERLLWGVDYADAALQVGSLDEVEDAVEHLRRQGAAGRPEAYVAAQRCNALLTAAKGDVDLALHDLVAIVDRRGAECPFEHARSQLALGQVDRRAGYKGLAAQALNEAAEAFDSLGTPRWAERARDEGSRVGLHPSDAALTASERRVAELVAAGRSNQETATALFMAPKTVEANLTRIYRKLGIRSRTELANHMNTKGSASTGSQTRSVP